MFTGKNSNSGLIIPNTHLLHHGFEAFHPAEFHRQLAVILTFFHPERTTPR
jgi:hypothetical protein